MSILFCTFDAVQAVTTLDFHPTVAILASGSKDCTVKLFDYSKPSAKRAYNVLQEVAPVRCLYFHPSGDFMIVGTEQSTGIYLHVYIYDYIHEQGADNFFGGELCNKQMSHKNRTTSFELHVGTSITQIIWLISAMS